MRLLLDAFWRAAAYCLHPQVIALSLLPLVIGGLTDGVNYDVRIRAITSAGSFLM